MPFLSTFGAASVKSFGLSRKKGAVGQINYTTPGTYSFTVPSGVTKMSILMVDGGKKGAGGSGPRTFRYFCPCYGYILVTSWASGSGGGGGMLRYINCRSVTAGQVYTVVVGTGVGSGQYGSCRPACNQSYVTYCGSEFGTINGTYGGNGGCGGACCCQTVQGGGGGGAAGLGAAGGKGANSRCPSYGTSAYGGNGGLNSYGGGGVGLGPRSAPAASAGAGGSGGSTATGSVGGIYGGGGAGGAGSSTVGYAGSNGGSGAVRIIWTYCGGPTRSYPTTNVGDL